MQLQLEGGEWVLGLSGLQPDEDYSLVYVDAARRYSAIETRASQPDATRPTLSDSTVIFSNRQFSPGEYRIVKGTASLSPVVAQITMTPPLSATEPPSLSIDRDCEVGTNSVWSCTFDCLPGDRVEVTAHDAVSDGIVDVVGVEGSCSLAHAECQAAGTCEATSEEPAALLETGTCNLLTPKTAGSCRAFGSPLAIQGSEARSSAAPAGNCATGSYAEFIPHAAVEQPPALSPDGSVAIRTRHIGYGLAHGERYQVSGSCYKEQFNQYDAALVVGGFLNYSLIPIGVRFFPSIQVKSWEDPDSDARVYVVDPALFLLDSYGTVAENRTRVYMKGGNENPIVAPDSLLHPLIKGATAVTCVAIYAFSGGRLLSPALCSGSAQASEAAIPIYNDVSAQYNGARGPRERWYDDPYLAPGPRPYGEGCGEGCVNLGWTMASDQRFVIFTFSSNNTLSGSGSDFVFVDYAVLGGATFVAPDLATRNGNHQAISPIRFRIPATEFTG